MSLNVPSRRAFVAASSSLRPATATATTSIHPSTSSSSSLVLRPRRTAAPYLIPAAATSSFHTSSPRSIDWGSLFGRKKKPSKSGTALDLDRSSARQEFKERMTNPQMGASPLIASEMEAAAEEEGDGRGDKTKKPVDRTFRNDLGTSLVREDLQRALDPDPRSRVRWERKMVIQHVNQMLNPRGAETKAERLARTERQLVNKSTPMPTSTKKLVHLAHQISGKTLEEAITQMRFSKKKMAKEILWQLAEARDLAVVERGMGLGRVQQQAEDGEATSASESEVNKGIQIQTKDGKWLLITDPTRIYIDQAWVGKGPWRAATPDYRARGRRFVKWSPSAYLSIVLKEEKTRIRLHDERVAKQAKKAPWVHLPNRPVTAQRPYYSW